MFTHWPDGSRAVTHVAKFERLEEDLRRIFPRLGLEVGVLPRENVKSSPRESRAAASAGRSTATPARC